jgi:hypothetical protein
MRASSRNLKALLDYLYPPLDQLLSKPLVKGGNAIEERHVIVYSKQGGGKTSTVQYLVKKAKERYGEENVHALEGEPEELLIWGWSKKPVEIFVMEDITCRKLSSDTVNMFFQVRHIKKEFTGVDKGLIVIFITARRYYSIPLELRTDADVMIFKHAPVNMYDYHVVKNLVGANTINLMSKLRSLGNDEKYKAYSFVVIGHEKLGFIKTDLVEKQTKQLVVKLRKALEPQPHKWLRVMLKAGIGLFLSYLIFVFIIILIGVFG